MKILRIIARLNIGGPARNAIFLTEGLRDIGFDSLLLCGSISKGEGDMSYLAEEKLIQPIVVGELGRDLSLKNDWLVFWKIYKIICKEMPDIIHTHTAKAGALGRLAGLLYRITGHSLILVHTFHGHVLHSYFGKVKSLFFVWVERILALFTDRVITVSESLKKELIEKFRIAKETKFSVIELGFELDDILKLPLRDNLDCVTIGIVGRLVPVKNHKMLFRVAKRITNHEPRITARFIVIGDGELRQELESYARDLEIHDIVEFRGWVRDLRDIYRELDIVVLTSLNEGTTVSIIEAMAARRSVVATKVGGVSDIVQDGKSGYLVNSNDDDIFVERLLDLIENSEKRIKFGEYGRGLVKERFLKERLIKDMGELYNNILKRRQERKK